jgi:acyl-CoA thioester hydrolase
VTLLPRSGRLEGGAYLYPVHVYYEDTDAGGVVYYANYLKFAERGRTEALRSVGVTHATLLEQNGIALAVHKVTAEYLSPARLDDDLTVTTRIAAVTGVTLVLDQRIARDKTSLFASTCTIVCVGKTGKAVRLPAALAATLDKLNPTTTLQMVKTHAR